MKKDRNTSAEAAELRRRAEARLRLRAAATKGAPARTEADTQRLVHELQVHQIELEMQNEELRESRAEVEAGLERYTELYDFAPVGYLTLGRDGAIRQVNLTGARLLGVERARLVGRRFGVFVGAPDRAGFKAFLEKVFASQAKEVCEVALLKDGKGPPNVHITATVSQDGQECRVMLADITERKQAAAEMKRLASFPMLNPRPIVEVDVAGHVHFCNPTATQMFPDLFQRGLGHPWLAGWEAVLRNLRKDGLNPIAREVYFDEKWYHQTIHFVDDAQRIRIYGADITARKKIEEALQKAHDELEEQVEERTVELRAALSEIKTMKDQLEAENIYFREETKLKGQFGNIIGQSDGLKYVLYRAEQVAPANTTILILGETGTGKELIAAAIHNMSPRKDRPLITVNCAALPANLIESELFGREKGAFTGADARRVGRFEVAHGSTLCLDEIGELPLELQAKLLRVIQHGEFERLGSSHTLKVDVRIVATTNRDLEEEVRKGRFRQDLYYRLNVFPITVPPLRQRTVDIPLLVEAFIARYSRKLGKQITSIQKETMKTLQEYPWPGNVRELESVLERAVILCPGPVLHLTDKLEISSLPMSSAIRTLEEVERNQIRKILKETRWRIEGKDGTAAILGLHPSTLRARMHKLGILRPKANASG
jgi:formate hydrogenlyase transcriptional activator